MKRILNSFSVLPFTRPRTGPSIAKKLSVDSAYSQRWLSQDAEKGSKKHQSQANLRGKLPWVEDDHGEFEDRVNRCLEDARALAGIFSTYIERFMATADTNTVRDLLRSAQQPVVVITTLDPELQHAPSTDSEAPDKGARKWKFARAMTVSSFASLSLDPHYVTFNVSLPSKTLAVIEKTRQFNVHFLRGTAYGAQIADHYARNPGRTQAHFLPEGVGWSNRPSSTAWLLDRKTSDLVGTDVVTQVANEAPRLIAEDIIGGLGCTYEGRLSVPPHLTDLNSRAIVIGKIRRAWRDPESEDRGYLGYANRAYTRSEPVFHSNDVSNQTAEKQEDESPQADKAFGETYAPEKAFENVYKQHSWVTRNVAFSGRSEHVRGKLGWNHPNAMKKPRAAPKELPGRRLKGGPRY
ncbi:flavin reductase like domain-containing protein [Xylariomycetidae sp. FL0641]|nr:flavin reductase like domain-containing protein [Xylariomycetidae sp. FL0641]